MRLSHIFIFPFGSTVNILQWIASWSWFWLTEQFVGFNQINNALNKTRKSHFAEYLVKTSFYAKKIEEGIANKKEKYKKWNGRFEAVFRIQQSSRLTVWQTFFLILILFYLFFFAITSPKEFSKKMTISFLFFCFDSGSWFLSAPLSIFFIRLSF